MSATCIVNEYKSGSVKKFVTDYGYEFEAFIPNNCFTDTPIIMYEHGNNGYYKNWQCYIDKFETGECNSIIIRADRNNSIGLYNHIVDEYNLTESQRMTVSFSGGTVYALKETAQMVQQNPNASTPVAIIMDGFVPAYYLENEGIVDTFKENNVLVLAFGQSNDFNQYVDRYKELAKTGVNMVILRDNSAYGDSHGGVNQSFMEGGLLEFSLGEACLPDRYEIIVYDDKSGMFKTLDYSDVSSIDLIYNYFGIDNSTVFANSLANIKYYELSSDSSELQDYLNDIVSVIKKSSFSNMSFSGMSASSTTQVPAAIPSIVRKYFNSVSKTLNNIVSLTDTIAMIDPNYKKVDKNLSKNFMDNMVDSVINAVDDIDDAVFDIFD